MTKKDFELIASAIAQLELDAETKRTVAAALATKLRYSNPRFDALRFIAACE